MYGLSMRMLRALRGAPCPPAAEQVASYAQGREHTLQARMQRGGTCAPRVQGKQQRVRFEGPFPPPCVPHTSSRNAIARLRSLTLAARGRRSCRAAASARGRTSLPLLPSPVCAAQRGSRASPSPGGRHRSTVTLRSGGHSPGLRARPRAKRAAAAAAPRACRGEPTPNNSVKQLAHKRLMQQLL